MDIVLMN